MYGGDLGGLSALGGAGLGGAVANATGGDGNGGEKTKKWACKECHKAKTACEGNPCRRCQRLGKELRRGQPHEI